ncbi:hypothetical protein [[Eubacterium] cellulosolvens]
MPSHEKLIQNITGKSLIIGIFGIRGSGKTSKGYNILDLCHSSGRSTYVLKFPRRKAHLFPSYIKNIERIEDAPKRSCILIDEASLFYYHKESMSQASKLLSKMMITARHRDQTLIFTTVTAASIDLNIIRLLDVIFYCKPSKFSEMFEREKLKWVSEKARKEFENFTDDYQSYTYAWSEEWEGMLQWPLPAYWSDGLSRYLGDSTISQEEKIARVQVKNRVLIPRLPKRYTHILKAISKGYNKPKIIKQYYNINEKSVSNLLREMGKVGLIDKPHFWSGYEITDKALDYYDLRSAPKSARKKRQK